MVFVFKLKLLQSLNYRGLSEPLSERCLEMWGGRQLFTVASRVYITTWKGIDLGHNCNYWPTHYPCGSLSHADSTSSSSKQKEFNSIIVSASWLWFLKAGVRFHRIYLLVDWIECLTGYSQNMCRKFLESNRGIKKKIVKKEVNS